MSLINDALKQARQSQQPNPPSGQPPLRPVEPAPRRTGDWFLPLAVVVLAGVAAFFIGLALARHKPPTAAKATELSAAQPVAPAVAAPAIVHVTNAPAVSNTVAVVPSVSGMKLQGVVYGEKSWAIVDGKTVYVGDSVGGFRVKAISENGITLESPDGSEQKLGLGE
jgi:hypothetical protein